MPVFIHPAIFIGIFDGTDPASLPSFRLPQGDYVPLTQSRSPANKYLIETNSSLVDLSKFIG
ncbi:hypothetical protein [Pseudomonas sp. BF-R-16]|uniref:hypothetical protein n=1 Tax=Pseudomonas sp. BF-R-16 TaxID=2832362 RepID=UPI001CBCCFC6|nr:hypothetical protein [Pseudomonas sp. BF-R-16]